MQMKHKIIRCFDILPNLVDWWAPPSFSFARFPFLGFTGEPIQLLGTIPVTLPFAQFIGELKQASDWQTDSPLELTSFRFRER